MTSRIDKVYICNFAALRAKYSETGFREISLALHGLIAADKENRGLVSKIFDIGDDEEMLHFHRSAVVSGYDERGSKECVDAIWEAHQPDYIVLVDGPDVIPHISLHSIAGLNDHDSNIPSDLPYASSAKFWRLADRYLAITRVVGRLPATIGATDPKDLIAVIDAATKQLPPDSVQDIKYFSISAKVWEKSTRLSLVNLFGSHNDIHISPDACHPEINKDIPAQVHFINCHGTQANSQFFGEFEENYPVAMDSDQLAKCHIKDALVTAECCYGAQLYNWNMAGTHKPICITYLTNGALAYVGSTNIAYGPVDKNGQADLITQYFIEEALKGASTGRAFLLASQRFIKSQNMAHPTNLKTLAQFILLGDPSLVIFKDESTLADTADDINRESAARQERRKSLYVEGTAIAMAAASPENTLETPNAMQKRIINMMKSKSNQNSIYDNAEITTLSVTGGQEFRNAGKLFPKDEKIVTFVAVAEEQNQMPGLDESAENRAAPPVDIRVLTAHMLGDQVINLEEAVSR